MTSKAALASLRGASPSPSEEDGLSLTSTKRGRKESEQRRRVLMNQYFDELIALLSMLSERCIPKKMDKATTLQEAVQCIQVYSDLTKKPDRTLTLDIGGGGKTSKIPSKAAKSPSPDRSLEGTIQGLHTVGELLHFFLDAHDAFLCVVSDSGRVLFSTELITSLLGHMQTRLVGQNFFDFIHENDHNIFRDILNSEQSSKGIKLKDRPIITYPPKLVHFHMKLYAGETGYLPQYLQFKSIVYLRKWDSDNVRSGVDLSPGSPDPSSSESSYSAHQDNQSCLIVIGKLPTSLSMVDLPVGTNDVNFEFEMRVSREGRIIDIDKHACVVLGYTTSQIIGTSFFEYVDPYHLGDVGECMSTFLSDGLGTTTPYRFLTKGNRSIWLISKGYLSYNPWNNKPDHILLTNRILGCDQVLPEHRFFRNRRLLPDLEGHECYVPVVQIRQQSPPPPALDASACSPRSSTADSAVVSNRQEKLFNQSDRSGQVSSHHQRPVQPLQQQQMPQYPPQVANMQHGFPPQGQIPQQVGGPGGGQQPILQSTHQSTPAGPSTPVTPSALQGGIGTPGILQQSSPASAPSFPPSVQPQPPQTTPSVQSLEDMQRELERKNREIFEMQKKLFEQQQLFEKERSQFYSITAQVMQCISSNALNQMPPNMQMAFTTSADYSNSGMLSASQSKMVMDSPLPTCTNTQGPFSSDSVQSTSAPLWDSIAPHGSMGHGSYSTNTQPYSLHPPHQQATQQQVCQVPFGVTSSTSMPTTTGNFTTDSVSQIHPSNAMLSEQFGLSQAFKMSGHQTLAEHNIQFFSQQQQPSGSHPPPSQRTLSAPHSQTQGGGYGSYMSSDVLSNLTPSLSGSAMNHPSLLMGTHSQKQPHQHSSVSPNLADILNSARFS